MAGSRKKPVQLPIVQLLERVGKVSRQHVSRRQFFGAAHDRTGLLGGCQACRSVSAKKTLERLSPGINPPFVATCDSMACCQLCRHR
jgi:hypothetical protein